MDYNWLKAFHLFSVFAWMAGLFYLPRLFVYHALVEKQSLRSETFKLMERKLLKVIMNPSMIISWLLGLWLIHSNPDLINYYWFWLKLFCVVLMSIFHMYCAKIFYLFQSDNCDLGHKTFRLFNEIPTILLFIIIVMVVVKPL